MFILSHRNIILTSRDGDASLLVKAGSLVEVPEQFCDTPYFNALVKDGKIAIPAGKKDKEVIAADEESGEKLEKTVKRTRAKKD